MPLQLRNVPFEVKTVTEDGTFSGIASPYGNKDLGEDIVDAGAFTKTIAERGNKVRLLDGHKIRIGLAEVLQRERDADGSVDRVRPDQGRVLASH
jgi:HK97 family phage prohead protease